MAIYCPIVRKALTIIGRYPPQQTCYKFGQRQKAAPGTAFQFVKVRFEDGREPNHDYDVNNLVADGGSLEIAKAAPLIGEDAEESARVADPNYTPTLAEALRNPAEFVEGMTETSTVHRELPPHLRPRTEGGAS